MADRERMRSEIFQDMLEVTIQGGPAKKTHIMQKANLNTRTFERYFEFLLCEGYLTNGPVKEDTYTATDVGKELYRKLKEINHILCMDHIPLRQGRDLHVAKAGELSAHGSMRHLPSRPEYKPTAFTHDRSNASAQQM